MKYRVSIRPDALFDIIEAAKWYDEKQLGIGKEFSETVRSEIRSLSEKALMHAVRFKRKNVPWFIPPRFPYKIVYRIESDCVVVYAVTHAARQDREWKKRV